MSRLRALSQRQSVAVVLGAIVVSVLLRLISSNVPTPIRLLIGILSTVLVCAAVYIFLTNGMRRSRESTSRRDG